MYHPALFLIIALFAASPHLAQANPPETEEPFLRGMTVSCPGFGRIWGSHEMQKSLRELSQLGVEWVSIHPYATIERDGQISFEPAEKTGYLGRAATLAQEADVKLFWKPHLAYWGRFEWRGSITFQHREHWRRFFDDYKLWIVDQARFAERHQIPYFAVGVELEQTVHWEKEWRDILAAVRSVYSGRITYAANWDSLDTIPFWDAVDLIGVQAYFPLSSEESPTVEAIRKGWKNHLDGLDKLSEKTGKKILFAEIGYDLSPLAAREPWRTASRDNEATRALRRRLTQVALEDLEQLDFLAGMFWWKWIPGRTGSRDFAMHHQEMRDVLREAWTRRPSL